MSSGGHPAEQASAAATPSAGGKTGIILAACDPPDSGLARVRLSRARPVSPPEAHTPALLSPQLIGELLNFQAVDEVSAHGLPRPVRTTGMPCTLPAPGRYCSSLLELSTCPGTHSAAVWPGESASNTPEPLRPPPHAHGTAAPHSFIMANMLVQELSTVAGAGRVRSAPPECYT